MPKFSKCSFGKIVRKGRKRLNNQSNFSDKAIGGKSLPLNRMPKHQSIETNSGNVNTKRNQMKLVRASKEKGIKGKRRKIMRKVKKKKPFTAFRKLKNGVLGVSLSSHIKNDTSVSSTTDFTATEEPFGVTTLEYKEITTSIATETTTSPLIITTTTSPLIVTTTSSHLIDATKASPFIDTIKTSSPIDETTKSHSIDSTTTSPPIDETTTSHFLDSTKITFGLDKTRAWQYLNVTP